jgi:hypothetical protein
VVPVRLEKSQVKRGREVSGGRLVILVISGDYGFQVFGFEHLVAIQASDIVYPVTSGHHFSAGVIAGLHRKRGLSPF